MCLSIVLCFMRKVHTPCVEFSVVHKPMKTYDRIPKNGPKFVSAELIGKYVPVQQDNVLNIWLT